MIDYLFDKIDRYIDYGNSYSMRKALTTLNREFNIAISKKNPVHAKAVINATKKMYEKLSSMYRESEDKGNTMGYSQKYIAKTLRGFISHLIQKNKSEFGGALTYEKEIEHAINGQ